MNKARRFFSSIDLRRSVSGVFRNDGQPAKTPKDSRGKSPTGQKAKPSPGKAIPSKRPAVKSQQKSQKPPPKDKKAQPKPKFIDETPTSSASPGESPAPQSPSTTAADSAPEQKPAEKEARPKKIKKRKDGGSKKPPCLAPRTCTCIPLCKTVGGSGRCADHRPCLRQRGICTIPYNRGSDDDDEDEPCTYIGPNTGIRLVECFLNQPLCLARAFYFFFYAAYGSVFPFLTLYQRQLGLNAMQIGFLFAVRSLVEAISAPFWTAIADRFRAAKLVLLSSLFCWIFFTILLGFLQAPVPINCPAQAAVGDDVHSAFDEAADHDSEVVGSFMNVIEPWLNPGADNAADYFGGVNYDFSGHIGTTGPIYEQADMDRLFMQFLILTVLGEFFTAPTIALVDAYTLINLGESNTESYGYIRMYGSIGWGVSTLFAGGILDLIGPPLFLGSESCFFDTSKNDRNYYICFAILFPACLAVAAIIATQIDFCYEEQMPVVFCMASKLKEDDVHSITVHPDRAEIIQVLLIMWVTNLYPFLFAVFFLGIGAGFMFVFLYWYLQDLGGTPILFGISAVLAHGSEIVSYYLSFWMIKQFGHVNVVNCALAIKAIRCLYISMLVDPWFVLPMEVLQGFTHSLVWAASCSYIALLTPGHVRISAQGILQSIHMGLGHASGGLLAGYFIAEFDFETLLKIYGILCLILLSFLMLLMFNQKMVQREDVPMNDDIPHSPVSSSGISQSRLLRRRSSCPGKYPICDKPMFSEPCLGKPKHKIMPRAYPSCATLVKRDKKSCTSLLEESAGDDGSVCPGTVCQQPCGSPCAEPCSPPQPIPRFIAVKCKKVPWETVASGRQLCCKPLRNPSICSEPNIRRMYYSDQPSPPMPKPLGIVQFPNNLPPPGPPGQWCPHGQHTCPPVVFKLQPIGPYQQPTLMPNLAQSADDLDQPDDDDDRMIKPETHEPLPVYQAQLRSQAGSDAQAYAMPYDEYDDDLAAVATTPYTSGPMVSRLDYASPYSNSPGLSIHSPVKQQPSKTKVNWADQFPRLFEKYREPSRPLRPASPKHQSFTVNFGDYSADQKIPEASRSRPVSDKSIRPVKISSHSPVFYDAKTSRRSLANPDGGPRALSPMNRSVARAKSGESGNNAWSNSDKSNGLSFYTTDDGGKSGCSDVGRQVSRELKRPSIATFWKNRQVPD